MTADTAKDVFDPLGTEGYDVSYFHIPTTPEMDFKLSSIDLICKITFRHSKFDESLWHQAQQSIFVFNCQIGDGRSSLACIVVWLIFLKSGLIITNTKTKTNITTCGDKCEKYIF